MTRELKFRAWHKTAKEMLYGEAWQVLKWQAEGQPVEISQHIGRQDSTGKEMYEGDVLKMIYPAGFSLSIVKFGDYDNGEEYEDNVSGYGWYLETENHYFGNKDKSEEITRDIDDIKGYLLSNYEHKVIGNIYESKELLG